MSDTTYKIWYYIEGTSDIAPVSVSLNDSISDLKRKIHSNNLISLSECDPAFILPTKVRYIMTFMDTDVIYALH